MAKIVKFPIGSRGAPSFRREDAEKAGRQLRTRVTNILMQFAKGVFPEVVACSLLEEMLTENWWLDCGSYYVCLFYCTNDNNNTVPAIDIRGKQYSKSGVCPNCHARQPRRLLGEGNKTEVICSRCSTVYTTNEVALVKAYERTVSSAPQSTPPAANNPGRGKHEQ